MNVDLAIFGGLAVIAAASAVGVVAFNNAIRSGLCLVLNFFVLACLYFLLTAELLGITQILVYLGAIMVLFLFVIMLLNLSSNEVLTEKRDLKRLWAGLFGVGLLLVLMAQVVWPLRFFSEPNAPEGFGAPQAIGMTLWTQYSYPLLVTSVLLMIGVVGSILLAKRRI